MENLKKKQLDKILNGAISTEKCASCGSGSCEIVFDLTWLSRDGVKIRCQHCENEAELQGIHTVLCDEKRIAIPITFNSLVKAVFKAVNAWNQSTVHGGAAQ